MATTRGRLFVFSAPSGGGKTSLTRALVPRLAQRGIRAEISVSYTTRAPRPGEQDGVHYHFITDAAFVNMIERGEFLEHAEVFGRRYGTGRTKTEALLTDGAAVFLDIDWQGAEQVKRRALDAVGIFILPPSREELDKRLRGRGQDSDTVIARRMAQAQMEMSHYSAYEYLIVNRVFDEALAELEAVVSEPTCAKSLNLRREIQERRHAATIAKLMAPGGPIG